jgi:ABC-2 type transport system permease protein
MNWKTFTAMLARDAHVARRNLIQTLLQNLLQPLMFVFVFGRVMTSAGMLPEKYKSMLLPGIMAMSMIMSGVWAVAMPLISEFQFTKEIEDRLLAPMDVAWVAVEKVIAGMLQALTAGVVVLLAAWAIMGSGLAISFRQPLAFAALAMLVALLSAAGGLALGCSVGQTQVGLMFSLVLAPMIMFGCTYYPWSALANFPALQMAVLINPMVYASEGLRATLVPQFPHLSMVAILAALFTIDVALLAAGLRQFHKKAIG